MKQRKLLSTDDVLASTRIARATLARMVKDGRFPAPLQGVGIRRNLWCGEVIAAWIKAKTAPTINEGAEHGSR